jgi:hypothetical protein
MAALERLAALLDEEPAGASNPSEDDRLARALAVRHSAERTVNRVAGEAAGLLGGTAFLGSPDAALLLAAARPLAFHPPSAAGVADAMDAWFTGGPFRF